jgi:hypothetical protein
MNNQKIKLSGQLITVPMNQTLLDSKVLYSMSAEDINTLYDENFSCHPILFYRKGENLTRKTKVEALVQKLDL